MSLDSVLVQITHNNRNKVFYRMNFQEEANSLRQTCIILPTEAVTRFCVQTFFSRAFMQTRSKDFNLHKKMIYKDINYHYH